MFSVFFFILALIFTLFHLMKKGWQIPQSLEVFLSYILLFSVGLMGIAAAYAHIFMGPETAKMIGWQPGSPFQFEMGMANLSYGVLGVLAYWIRGRFWDAVIIGWSILLLGCFVGHVMDYYIHHNTAPYNWGTFLWFNDFFLPLLSLGLLAYLRKPQRNVA